MGAESKVGVVDAYVNYFKASGVCYNGAYNADEVLVTSDTALAYGDKEIYNIGLGFDVAKNVRVAYEYMWGDDEYDARVSKDGWVARVDYKGAGEEVGSWGAYAQWFDQPVNCVLHPTTDASTFLGDGGYEGWNLGVQYTLAKNILLDVNYFDTEAKVGNKEDQSLFVDVYFAF